MSEVEITREDLAELAERTDLDGIHYEVITAVRIQNDREPAEPVMRVRVGGGDLPDGAGEFLRVSLNVTVETEHGRAEVEPCAEYRIEPAEGKELTRELAAAFASEISVMTLIPYAREALSSISAKVLDETIVMPLFTRRRLSAEFDMSEHAP